MFFRYPWRTAFCFLIAWPLVAWLAADMLVVKSESAHADALVILAGSSTYKERTHQAAADFRAGLAPRIILTNDNQLSGWSTEQQRNPFFVERAFNELQQLGVPENQIEVVPEIVSNTRDEAWRVRHYAEENGLHSILVVTSAYQLRRARWIFSRVFASSNLAVAFDGVSPGDQTPLPATWWLHRQGWRMVAGEYLKLAYYSLTSDNLQTVNAATLPPESPPQNLTGIKTDRRIYREPPLPPLPRAGRKFIDSVFGTEIMRATDEADGPAPGLGTYYSHWPTFNANNTRLLIRRGESGDAIIKEFDAATFTIGAKHSLPSLPGSANVSWEGATWSSTDPNIIYCHAAYMDGGMKLYQYDVRVGTAAGFKLIKSFSGLSGGKDYLKQMYVSGDDDVFCWLHMRAGSSEPLAYLVYRRSTDKTLFHNPASEYVGGINEVHVDKSGKWLQIALNENQPDKSRTRFLNLQTGRVDFLYNTATDRPAGHGDLGHGTIIGFDNFNDGISRRRLDAIHQVETVFYFRTGAGPAGGVADWTQDFHGTMLADNEDWITIGTFSETANTLPGSGIFKDEIIQVALDGSQRLRRICHTRSAIDNKTNTTGYWAAPKPTISRDGRFIAFTSNWEKSGRYDLFIAKIDPAPYLNATPIRPATAQRPRRARPRITSR